MKKNKLLNCFVSAAAALVFLAIVTACQTPAKEKTTVAYTPREKRPPIEKYVVRDNFTTQELIEEMGLGINLGNTLEACGSWINNSSILNYEKAWGSPVITEDIIAGYADAGFSSLRIPVAWSNMMLPDYVINPDLFDRVEAV